MRRTFCALIGGWLLFAVDLRAAERWSDDRLPVQEGLELWFDCSRQNAGRSALQLPPLGSGNATDYLVDGSGRARHLAQHRLEARPRFRQEFSGAFLSFDGKDDALLASHLRGQMTNETVFLVAAPRSNGGNFRGFFGLSQAGGNDYIRGLNLDLGPEATAQLSYLNAEGSGFSGAAQLLQGPALSFGCWHIFALESQPGAQSARLFLDGKAHRARDRQNSLIHLDEFVLGARYYSNSGEPPYTQGFFHGDVAEFLLYNRVLTISERVAVEGYLNKKYGQLLNRPPELLDEAKPLVAVTNLPPVQMFVRGFTARELPLSLKNINNVNYRSDGKLVALGYDGQIYLLRDTDGDGLEDHAWLERCD
jgi:hypothetical protein